MAIVVGDIHGCVEKVQAFLDYRPDEVHIALGDYLDSFSEPPERQIKALQLLLDSGATLLWGNHDLHYLKVPPWICTGFQHGREKQYQDIIEANKSRFLAACVADGWLLTHAGVHVRLAKHSTNVVEIADRLNKKMAEYLEWPYEPSQHSIFAIGKSRGGECRNGGIFWYDFKMESGLAPVKQIFGHTETKEPVVRTQELLSDSDYVALDTTNNKNTCWLYDTSSNELVQLDLIVKLDNQPGYVCNLPLDEQLPFAEYLKVGCKSSPFKGGFWPADYRRWKPAYEEQKKRAAEIWAILTPEEQTRCDNIEFAAAHPDIAGWTPTYDDISYFRIMTTTRRIRYLPQEERGPFRLWLMGQGCPGIPGLSPEEQDFFHEYDYERWKRHPNSWEHP